MLGYEIADSKGMKELKNMSLLLAANEDEKSDVKTKFEMISELSKANIRNCIFFLIFFGFMFGVNIWGYRDETLGAFKSGKLGCEEVVHTRTKENQVKVDTTYNFYRIKPEKK